MAFYNAIHLIQFHSKYVFFKLPMVTQWVSLMWMKTSFTKQTKRCYLTWIIRRILQDVIRRCSMLLCSAVSLFLYLLSGLFISPFHFLQTLIFHWPCCLQGCVWLHQHWLPKPVFIYFFVITALLVFLVPEIGI